MLPLLPVLKTTATFYGVLSTLFESKSFSKPNLRYSNIPRGDQDSEEIILDSKEVTPRTFDEILAHTGPPTGWKHAGTQFYISFF